jgi:hypothetical protein
VARWAAGAECEMGCGREKEGDGLGRLRPKEGGMMTEGGFPFIYFSFLSFFFENMI